MKPKNETLQINSISSTDKKGKEASIRVRKISNGFVLSKEVYTPGKQGGKWENEETYYKVNPLANPDKTLAEIFQS